MKVKAVPAVAVAGALMLKVLAAAATTVTVALPLMDAVSVSVALTVCRPAVLRVAPPVKVCFPASPLVNA